MLPLGIPTPRNTEGLCLCRLLAFFSEVSIPLAYALLWVCPSSMEGHMSPYYPATLSPA